MKLIAVEIARATQIFVQEEVRPLAGTYFAESVRLTTERYGFAISPALTDATAGGAKFAVGRLIAGSRRINISELVVFSNAIQATTVTNTSDADYVVDDVLSWAISALGFREPQMHFPRLYESALIVEFERSVDHFLRPFEVLRSGVRESLEEQYNLHSKVSLSSFGIGIDPLQTAHLLPPLSSVLKTEFGLVRRTNAPYEADRFFSLSPFKTDTHRLLLEEFERAIPL